jgi:hypothetical protein
MIYKKDMSVEQFKQMGFNLKHKSSPFKKSGELTDKAKRFIRTQYAFNQDVDKLIPKGLSLNVDTGRFVKDKSVSRIVKKGKGKKAKKQLKLLPKYLRVGKTITQKKKKEIQKRIIGELTLTFERTNKKGEKKQYTKTIPFNEPYGMSKQQIIKKYESEDNKNYEDLIHIDLNDVKVQVSGKRDFSLSDLRLREANWLNISGMENNQEWNTKTGNCVRDYLRHHYWDDNYFDLENFEDIFEEAFPENEGVEIENIMRWVYTCDNIRYILLDEDEKVIQSYFPDNNKKKCRNLLLKIKNGHIYNYNDDNKVKSIFYMYGDGVKSFSSKTESKNKKEYKIEVLKCGNGDTLQVLCDTIYKTNTDVKRNQVCYTGGVSNFVIDDTRYYLESYEVNKCVEHYKENFTGQTPIKIMTDIVKDMNLPTSRFNKETYSIMETNGVKDLAHLGVMNNITRHYVDDKWDKKVKSIDIKRSHTANLLYPLDEFMLFNYGDHFLPYEEMTSLELGLYYIETPDTLLFHKSGIYDRPILNVGLMNGIISQSDIKYFMKCRKSLPKDYFRTHLNEHKKNYDISPDMDKLITNSFIGNLGKSRRVKNDFHITTDKTEQDIFISENYKDIENCFFHHKISGVEYDIIKSEYDELFGGCFEKKVKKDNTGQDFYIYGKTTTSSFMNNNVPMYQQILNHQSIRMYEKMLEIGKDNVLYRKSDCITFFDKNNIVDKVCKNGYGNFRKCENPTRISEKEYKETIIDVPHRDWVVNHDIKTSNDWEKFIPMIDAKKSCLIHAPPGMGKSHIIKQLKKHYGDKAITTAFMNATAVMVKGKTIHTLFRYSEKKKTINDNVWNTLRDIEVVIIDEVSTLTEDLWSVLEQAKKMLGISILGFGDDHQLKPVDNYTGYFESKSVIDLFDSQLVPELEFHENCRHTETEYKDLLEIRNGNKEHVYNMDPEIVNLEDVDKLPHYGVCYTNRMRKIVNKVIVDKKEEELVLSGSLDGYKSKLTNKALEQYCDGTRIGEGVELMCFQTKHEEYYNGIRYVVKTIDINSVGEKQDVIILEGDNGEIIIDGIIDLLNHFTLGYCFTNHKILGATLTDRYGIYEYDKSPCDWCYVAVSRAKPLNNFVLVKTEYDEEEC